MIGETVYFHDESRRKYGEDGFAPRERYKFVPVVITGETPRSWKCEYQGREYRINKKTMTITSEGYGLSNRVYTAEQMEEAVFLRRSYEIANRVRDLRDAAKLRAIIEVLDA